VVLHVEADAAAGGLGAAAEAGGQRRRQLRIQPQAELGRLDAEHGRDAGAVQHLDRRPDRGGHRVRGRPVADVLAEDVDDQQASAAGEVAKDGKGLRGVLPGDEAAGGQAVAVAAGDALHRRPTGHPQDGAAVEVQHALRDRATGPGGVGKWAWDTLECTVPPVE
jgi:hypothetical protein